MVDDTQNNVFVKDTDFCSVSISHLIPSRRCFVSGEYCSNQPNIQEQRKRIHENGQINAFVVMNFSNMSDVVYNWRIQGFIQSLTKYLFFSEDKKQIYCLRHVLKPKKEGQSEVYKITIEKEHKQEEVSLKKIDSINVIRADTAPASNYVICNRICQQIQIADLIIVDVSNENANVFYEFGMAVALGKMILPICYNNSYFEKRLPEALSVKIETENQKNDELEHHIDCFPWRRALFEHYGIRYKRHKDTGVQQIEYKGFSLVNNKAYGFSDLKFSVFPYNTSLEENINSGNEMSIGEKIYTLLSESYNNSKYEHNTLVVYTLDGFLNEDQAGQCMINYYVHYIKSMKKEKCFCGERVGVLIQSNVIPEDVKDAKDKRYLLYDVGEIIHIGMNQATYEAQEKIIHTDDYLHPDGLSDWNRGNSWESEIYRFIKNFIRNRSILIYPENPVYISRISSGLQRNIVDLTDEDEMEYSHYYCMYHMMLKTLKFTNEIVVDISRNTLQSYFWLGTAHGSCIDAITVQHAIDEKEKNMLGNLTTTHERNIFDVSGLWKAVLFSNDTEGFYRQLALVQLGIKQHTRLMLQNMEQYEYQIYLHMTNYNDNSIGKHAKDIGKILNNKSKNEEKELESYYRDAFWRPILRYNRLRIYYPLYCDNPDEIEAKRRYHSEKWEQKAVASWSQYLSKKMLIGEYHIEPLSADTEDSRNANQTNFICLGEVNPFKKENINPSRIECISSQKPKYTDHYEELLSQNADEYPELSQLILWRELTDNTDSDNDETVNYRVSIFGRTGSARQSLSSLFVDDDSDKASPENDNLLCELQKEIRNQLCREYKRELEKRLNNIEKKVYGGNRISFTETGKEVKNQKNGYHKRVINTMLLYLSTELYSYFFPFLSKEDEERICNGVKTFVASLMSADMSPFSIRFPPNGDERFSSAASNGYVIKTSEVVSETLGDILNHLRGVEVLYQKANNSNKIKKLFGVKEIIFF